jgi:uncharacterized protein YndB with AHSA1/START domain
MPVATTDDYTYEMQVRVPPPQIIEALTDGEVIGRWWTVVTRAERHGDEVRLFVGEGAPFVFFTVAHDPEVGVVTWTVNECAAMDDWVGTQPSFTVHAHGDGTCTVAFRHAGLNPALECFDQCRAGWNHFMPSLHQFLETGVGRPNEPRDPAA